MSGVSEVCAAIPYTHICHYFQYRGISRLQPARNTFNLLTSTAPAATKNKHTNQPTIITKHQKCTHKATKNEPRSPPGPPLRAKRLPSEAEGAQESPRRNPGQPKRAARKPQDTPKEVPRKPKRAQESRNHHQCGSKMVRTASTWVPAALSELTFMKM